jgi:hypothetical protein
LAAARSMCSRRLLRQQRSCNESRRSGDAAANVRWDTGDVGDMCRCKNKLRRPAKYATELCDCLRAHASHNQCDGVERRCRCPRYSSRAMLLCTPLMRWSTFVCHELAKHITPKSTHQYLTFSHYGWVAFRPHTADVSNWQRQRGRQRQSVLETHCGITCSCGVCAITASTPADFRESLKSRTYDNNSN